MKEYIAQTGGRYTYVDDLLNLQELARSVTAIFDDCPGFIISGCRIVDNAVLPGYVWLNGHIRYFEGAANPAFPFYIWESNQYQTITYADDVSKQGRCNYLCSGGGSVPQTPDPVTGKLPAFIELTEHYAPRLADKFFGRYSLLLDTPHQKQTVSKDVAFTGKVTVQKEVESPTAVIVSCPEKGYSLKSTVVPSGQASVGFYEHGSLKSEIRLGAEGYMQLLGRDASLFRADKDGFSTDTVTSKRSVAGSITLEGNNIYNHQNDTDLGAVAINRFGYGGTQDCFRDFAVYDGRTEAPMLLAEGSSGTLTVGSAFTVKNPGKGISLQNPTYPKDDATLTNLLRWEDRDEISIGHIGYCSTENSDFTLRNDIGNVVVSCGGWVNIDAELHVRGVNVADTYLTIAAYTEAMYGKVDKVEGRQLSEENFTPALKAKLESIATGTVASEGTGYVTAQDVAEKLSHKLSKEANLSELSDTSAARLNLDVYSRPQSDGLYFHVQNALSEATSFSASEVEGKTPEEIIAMKQQRQQAVRDNIDAEKKGIGELKLSKASNLSDLPDKSRARSNLQVYSSEEIDRMMSGKLDSDKEYAGVVFSTEDKKKLDGIKTGRFADENVKGESSAQVEGYVMTSSVKNELSKKANLLLNGYTADQKNTIAENIGVYSKSQSDGKYGKVSEGLQDYVTYQVMQGNTTSAAKQALRDKIDAAGRTDLNDYVKKSGKLSDLSLPTENDRKAVCQNIGAAYAPDYQPILTDSGWIACGGENAGTLYARQIGNIVSIQGIINTSRTTSNTWGICATIPNTISPPRYGCHQTSADFNDEHKYNRGCSFKIQAGSRNILIHERGMGNVLTELNFTYFT